MPTLTASAKYYSSETFALATSGGCTIALPLLVLHIRRFKSGMWLLLPSSRLLQLFLAY